jgi:hypothetical protein
MDILLNPVLCLSNCSFYLGRHEIQIFKKYFSTTNNNDNGQQALHIKPTSITSYKLHQPHTNTEVDQLLSSFYRSGN